MSSKQPSLLASVTPIVILVGLLGLNVFIYGDNSLSGANQFALLIAAFVAGGIAIASGLKFTQLIGGIVDSIVTALPAIIILLLIGSLAGTWMLSGIVPAMIYYGLEILNPTIFLFASCVVCAIVSIATGSSWSTIATVGIALLGIGQALGFSEGLTAGAIISGAYFGDKMSPLSDTTNLAPAVAGTDLFTHIRYMAITTVPSISIALLIFLIWGFVSPPEATIGGVEELQTSIGETFNVSGWLFLVPIIVIGLIVKKVSAIPALFIGAVLGGIFALIFQQDLIAQMGTNTNAALNSYELIINALTVDTTIPTENEVVSDLLGTSGMAGMLGTIWLILCAMIFGGVMERAGFLKRITSALMQRQRKSGPLVATTAATCVVFNATASDQYLSIVVPGRMYAEKFAENDLPPELLSRSLEDSGTVTSVLIPWNTCGAVQSSVLGVATMVYLPFCFFNLISPLMTIAVAYIGFKIKKVKTSEQNPEKNVSEA